MNMRNPYEFIASLLNYYDQSVSGSTLKINCQEERERLKSDSDEKAVGYDFVK